MRLRFVNGRPISPLTCAFLAWVAEHLAAEDVRVLALIWDNAPWHVSREVRDWVRGHNRQVKRTAAAASWSAGCRAEVPGSTRSSPDGPTASARWSTPSASSPAKSSSSGSAIITDASFCHRSHSSSPEHALGGILHSFSARFKTRKRSFRTLSSRLTAVLGHADRKARPVRADSTAHSARRRAMTPSRRMVTGALLLPAHGASLNATEPTQQILRVRTGGHLTVCAPEHVNPGTAWRRSSWFRLRPRSQRRLVPFGS